ncbi:inositol hexakisphosphate and diphosphoinositol-pentakisphosphate kinase [Binucleata daphniae]
MTIGFCIMEHKLSKPHVKKFVDRFKKNSNVIVFDQKEILETNYEKWPKVSFLISFYHTSLPLHKVYKYIKLNNIPCINDLFMQYSLFDRRVIYTILMALKIKVPEHYFVNRCQAKIPRELKVYLEKRFATSFVFEETSIEEHNTHIIINGNILKKPFVEKPVNAEDHNIYVYLQDGSVRKLFRKQANVSSKVFWDIKEIRKSGSFIYEKFYPADDDNDIKVYALGKETAYAETRKAPTKDGFVERLECGKEKRNMIKLLDHEYEYARKITTGFNQFVCGFDILRSNGVSYVIDVNGWSFVKNNRTYYDKCAELLKREIEKRTNAFKCTCQNQGTETNTTIIGTENTDKSTNKSQKNLQEELARMENQASMENNNYGSNENQSKKVTAQMKISENDMKGTELEPTKLIIKPNHNNYELTIKNEMYAQPMHKNTTEQQQPRKKCTCQNKKIQKIVRVYRHGDRTPKQKLKVKMKATNNMFNKEVYVQESFDNIIDVFTKMNNDNLLPVINCLNTYKNQKGTKLQIKFVNGCAEIICKWGGVLTHTGAFHCHELADGLNYYVSDNNTEIFDNMKIYSSSEGRVYESALEFANSFGNRKFEVIKDKELLDDTFHATELIEAGRKGLSLEFEKFKTTEDEEYFLRTFENIKLQEDDNKANK